MKILIRLCLLLTTTCVLAQQPDSDWVYASEEIREQGLNTPVLGKRWGVFARSEGDQFTLKLDISNDMQRGGWVGDYRTAPRIGHFKIDRVDADGERRPVSIDRLQATGPASENGRWKPGESTLPLHAVAYRISYEEVSKLKSARSLVVRYSTFEKQDEFREVSYALTGLDARLEQLEADVASLEGGRKFVLTNEQIETMPMNQLPREIYRHWQPQIEQAAEKIGLTVAELGKFSMRESRQMFQRKIDEQAEAARLAEIEAQKISEAEIQQFSTRHDIPIGELRGLSRDQVESKVSRVQQQRERERKERERLAELDRKYGQKMRGFEWPYLGCSRPEILAVGASDYEVSRANRRVEEWDACMVNGFYEGTHAIQQLIDDLGGSWQIEGDQWSWNVPAECECRDNIKQLLAENETRHERRIEALDDFYAAIDSRNQRQDSQNQSDEMWSGIYNALDEMEADMERMNRQRQNQWGNQYQISPGYQ